MNVGCLTPVDFISSTTLFRICTMYANAYSIVSLTRTSEDAFSMFRLFVFIQTWNLCLPMTIIICKII